ncbi:hypothetical protein JZO70_12545 [Enterococcus sp. 669A]|uniref:DUF5666 domain-containing protein n=1 Tax=Candidatus Enterococcus moelleringii TaxID=2815325 RepID=A0ABS3LBI6_9ENTE|nr:hypothetical protein [Enterococcus sp. 669A]MBO1306997.1 hypothetical protein [Enterococcus sp. 669A]
MKKKYVILMIAGLFTGMILHRAVYSTGPTTRIQGTVTEISPEYLVFEDDREGGRYLIGKEDYDFSDLVLELGSKVSVEAEGPVQQSDPARFTKILKIQKSD